MKKVFLIFLVLILLPLMLFSIRQLSPRELDDVSPASVCSEDFLNKADILYIIPKFNNESISNNAEWCQYILSLNKTVGLHGVYHTYREFEIDRNQEYLQQGIDEFNTCFGYEPKLFKPPQNRISQNNKKLIKENGMMLRVIPNKIIHKIYHCVY